MGADDASVPSSQVEVANDVCTAMAMKKTMQWGRSI